MDYENEHIYKQISQLKDESCEVYFVEGKCPKHRHCTKECPLYPEAEYCSVEKA